MPTKLKDQDRRKVPVSFSIERTKMDDFALFCANQNETISEHLRAYVDRELNKNNKKIKNEK
jgi:hypothetical protein